MRKIRFNERRFAMLCAVVLVSMSAFAAIRESGVLDDIKHNFAQAKTQAPTLKKDDNTSKVTNSDDKLIVNDEQTPAETAVAPQQSDTTAKSTYVYTAVAGDSYTALARDAVNQYATANKIDVSPTQLLGTEIGLANIAGSPTLEIGQSVNISKDAVSQALKDSGTVASITVTKEDSQENKTTSTDKTDEVYTAQVKAGDCYTTIARSAVAQYIKSSNVSLNDAQKVAAETMLAEAASWPQVEIAQQVTVSQVALKDAISAAKNLNTNGQSTWQQYANLIVFAS